MTPKQAIREDILCQAIENGDIVDPKTFLSEDNIDRLYEELLAKEGLHWEYESDFRYSGEDTDLPCFGNQHYEAKYVAARLKDGRWIGWTFWYGGGKHSDPGSIPWMEDASFLRCTEEEIVITQRTFEIIN